MQVVSPWPFAIGIAEISRQINTEIAECTGAAAIKMHTRYLILGKVLARLTHNERQLLTERHECIAGFANPAWSCWLQFIRFVFRNIRTRGPVTTFYINDTGELIHTEVHF